MATPPSYREATARPDWLRLASPYVSFQDYRALCCVDRRSWRIFAPRLWASILHSARLSGVGPEDGDGDDLDWWVRFVFDKLPAVRPATRCLVRVLDMRDFASHACSSFSSDHYGGRALDRSLRRALELLPNVASLLLDHHADIDPASLLLVAADRDRRAQLRGGGGGLLQLSVRHCSVRLPLDLFRAPGLSRLVFLDVSALPGSIGCLLRPGVLQDICVLKVCDRELDDRTAAALANSVGRRLWSLDLSGNRLTDAVVDSLAAACFPLPDLRSPARFQVEGALVSAHFGAPQHGPFVFLRDSPWSATRSHPERYLIDAPRYHHADADADADAALPLDGLRPRAAQRSDCRSLPRQDSADAFARLVLREADPAVAAADHSPISRGLTHLALSDNEVSALGIDRLFRASNGHLESFACDSSPLLPAAGAHLRFWPRSARLFGLLGREHLFRPVVASNLRVLRVHHSAVTNLAGLEVDGLPALARTYLAETLVLPRADEAFPIALAPETNPRLTSLTLTRIPRRSSGPLIAKLIGLLEALSAQECAVQATREMMPSSRSSTHVLSGLTHLRLEFEPETYDLDPSSLDDDDDDDDDDDHLDAAALLARSDDASGGRAFSFFATNNDTTHEPCAAKTPHHRHQHPRPPPTPDMSQQPGIKYPSTVVYSGHWNGQPFSLPVWTGECAAAASSPVIREYRRLVLACNVRDAVGPVTPGQVRAGAPPDAYVFHGTWCAAVMPPALPAPSQVELAAMRDVAAALREYRRRGRARHAEMELAEGKGRVAPGEPHLFWRGKLELVD